MNDNNNGIIYSTSVHQYIIFNMKYIYYYSLTPLTLRSTVTHHTIHLQRLTLTTIATFGVTFGGSRSVMIGSRMEVEAEVVSMLVFLCQLTCNE
jgi:hypothetical protein